MVLNIVKYYEIFMNVNEGILMNPETKKAIEEVNHLVENNLPVEKHLLYEIAPNIFHDEL